MTRYLLQRLAASALLILALLTVVYAVVDLAPGDPVDRILDPDLDAAGRAALRRSMGLDRPLVVRYGDWLGGVLLRGDLGRSLRLHRPVAEILGDAIPNTLLLTVPSLALHLLCAVLFGAWLAKRAGSRRERGATVAGLFLYSLPSFWLGLMLILVFARGPGWLPTGGMHSVGAASLPWAPRLLDLLRHMVLPVFVLGVVSSVGTARYLRNSLIEVLGQPYILSARARGLPERTVLWRHALRNGLLPVITQLGLSLPFLLGGAVVVEHVFAWPGMGRVAVEALFARDYPVVMGTTALASVLVVLGNLLADLAVAAADPRVRLDRERGV